MKGKPQPLGHDPLPRRFEDEYLEWIFRILNFFFQINTRKNDGFLGTGVIVTINGGGKLVPLTGTVDFGVLDEVLRVTSATVVRSDRKEFNTEAYN